MANFLYRTKGNANPKGKPRVYFTCHPDDFGKYFDKICDDIFKTHDCAIFYTDNLEEEIEEKYKESDLGQMNLFVIPVTFKLLHLPNRAMDSDFPYAKEKNIPVLPFMMEPGLDSLYSLKTRFGELQYLNPYANDLTAVPYEEKLKKHLEAILISSETVERIRKAFDAYIFLSYRKKDRHYANELMKMIHSHPEFRDIAIWYDEFLTPGESFRENIERLMKDSRLFTLLVTPSLLEYVDGKPNYVMEHEYPDAKAAGMDILPTEMEATDKDELRAKYDGIPDCVDPNADEEFRTRIADTLSGIAISENNDDPEHNFLIGLAYLEGIDVEKNTERGVELITSAAEGGQIEAMEKLYKMYSEGSGIRVDYAKAVYWAKRIVDYNKKHYGKKAKETLDAQNNLAVVYSNIGEYQKALKLQKKIYSLRYKILSEEHPDTLYSLSNLATTYGTLGDHQKALELIEKCYPLQCKVLGEEHPHTLASLNNLAITYGKLGDHQKDLELNEKCYALLCKVLGEEHPFTLLSLGNIATCHMRHGDHQKALELIEKCYHLQCKVLGEEHPHTLASLNNLAITYGMIGDYTNALELIKKCYPLMCKILGEEHPDTLNSLGVLALTYYKLGEHQIASKLLDEYHKKLKG